MSENVPERPPTSEGSPAASPPPPAYGVRPGSAPVDTLGAPTRSASMPSDPRGPYYGPVHRYARPPAQGDHGSAASGSNPPPQTYPTQAYPPPPGLVAPGAWPPPPAPVATAWGPPPPPWGPAPPWSPPPRRDYAPWSRRVLAALIDAVPSYVAAAVLVAGYLPTYAGFFRGQLDVPPRYGLVVVGTLLYLAAAGLAVYNHYFLAGRTGQSFGKRVMGIWLVSQITGRPIGAFNAFLRNLLHVVDSFGYVGYLWPLWDDERQTLADKLAQTIVVRTAVPPLAAHERRPG